MAIMCLVLVVSLVTEAHFTPGFEDKTHDDRHLRVGTVELEGLMHANLCGLRVFPFTLVARQDWLHSSTRCSLRISLQCFRVVSVNTGMDVGCSGLHV
jgi:hypothetical protein